MQKGDKVLIRARRVETREPVVIEKSVSRIIDDETIEYGDYRSWHDQDGILVEAWENSNVSKYGTGLGCWCLPEDDLKAHAERI